MLLTVRSVVPYIKSRSSSTLSHLLPLSLSQTPKFSLIFSSYPNDPPESPLSLFPISFLNGKVHLSNPYPNPPPLIQIIAVFLVSPNNPPGPIQPSFSPWPNNRLIHRLSFWSPFAKARGRHPPDHGPPIRTRLAPVSSRYLLLGPTAPVKIHRSGSAGR